MGLLTLCFGMHISGARGELENLLSDASISDASCLVLVHGKWAVETRKLSVYGKYIFVPNLFFNIGCCYRRGFTRQCLVGTLCMLQGWLCTVVFCFTALG